MSQTKGNVIPLPEGVPKTYLEAILSGYVETRTCSSMGSMGWHGFNPDEAPIERAGARARGQLFVRLPMSGVKGTHMRVYLAKPSV